MDLKITIDDPVQLAGIAWAREQSNLSRAEDEQFATDDDYLTWVIEQAVASYARDKDQADLVEAVEAAAAGDLAKLDAVRAALADKAATEAAR